MKTTFRNELEKIFGSDAVFDDTRYVGSACIGSLAPDIRGKAEFVTTGVADEYAAIRIKIINRHEGEIDVQTIKFKDIWGRKPIPDNPNFSDGILPRMWMFRGELEWYAYHPTKEDFDILRNEISEYTEMFRDMTMEMEQGGMQMG